MQGNAVGLQGTAGYQDAGGQPNGFQGQTGSAGIAIGGGPPTVAATYPNPNDWYCLACNDLQFARNPACRKCGTPNPNSQGILGQVGGMVGQADVLKPCAWNCISCGDLQLASSTECRRCQCPNPNPDPRQQALASGDYSAAGCSGAAPAPTAFPAKPGDWICPSCGDHQFARNQQCRRCNSPNPYPMGQGNITFASGGMQPKPGDWFCPSCNDLQFARNIQCKRCGSPNPSPTNNTGSSFHMKPGDWLCPSCGDLQFARNAQCRKCGTANPEPNSMMHPAPSEFIGKGKGKEMKPGDWNCPKCGDHQFAKNLQCRRCGSPYPGDVAIHNKGNVAPWMAPGSGKSGSNMGMLGSGGMAMGACGGGGSMGMQVKGGVANSPVWGISMQGSGVGKGSMDGPMGGPMSGRMGGPMGGPVGAPMGGEMKSWQCPNCHEVVFPRNNQCLSCGTPRPENSQRPRSRSPRH